MKTANQNRFLMQGIQIRFDFVTRRDNILTSIISVTNINLNI